MSTENQEIELDLRELFQAIWHRLWLVILATILLAAATFAGTYYLVTPLYTSTAKLYVNNSSISIGSTKVDISSSDISASQSLVDTYIVILETRTTLEEVLEVTGLNYSYAALENMITAASVNGTEIFQISVESPDPAEAELIANTIAEVLPTKIASIVDGSSVRVVDFAVSSSTASSPNYKLNTLIGGLLGAILSCLLIVLEMMFNEIIKSEEDITRNFDLPILTVIPNVRTTKADNAYHNNYKKREAYRMEATEAAKSVADKKTKKGEGK